MDDLPVDDLRIDDLAFIVGWCAICNREVLTCADYDPAGEEVRHCVHCDQRVARALHAVRGDELTSRGYAVHEERGCGRPDCGNGRCGR